HVEVGDVTLLLEDPGDAFLETRGGHLRVLVQRLVGVADSCQHVRYGISEHLGYQLDFVMPGITPWCARSRGPIRQRPNLRQTARGRPQRLQRELARTGDYCVPC